MEGWKVTSRERQTQINMYRDELTETENILHQEEKLIYFVSVW